MPKWKFALFLLWFVLLVIIGMNFGCAGAGLTPAKAWLLFTRESMGCPNGQEIREDVTAKVIKNDGTMATITEIKNPEDVFNRNELYLLFSAKPINHLAGYFVIKLWCDGERDKEAVLRLDQTELRSEGKFWVLTLHAGYEGFLHLQMLYSRSPEICKAWFSCPGTGVNQPYQLTFLNAYPLEGAFDGIPAKEPNGNLQNMKFKFNPLFLTEAETVDRCQVLLENLNSRFGTAESRFVWRRDQVNEESIRRITDEASSGRRIKYQVSLKIDDGTVIQTGPNAFQPSLRQMLALRNSNQALIGAEIGIRANLP